MANNDGELILNEDQEATRAEFEGILAKWVEGGFIEEGWRVRWDVGEGAFETTFRRKKHVYSLGERDMNMFILGATEMSGFYIEAMNHG